MSNIGLSVRPDILARIKAALSESSYREAMENSSTYNNRLVGERRQRMPFLDAQTGVAQSDCFLWMQKWERMPGKYEGQLYSYPSRKWRKKRRQYLMTDSYLQRAKRDIDSNENESIANASENNVKMETNDSNDKYYDSSKEAWYQEFDDGSDLPDAGELDDPESDYDDYEEYSSKKKKKRKDTPKRKRVEYTDAEKPYSCDLCGARYKTRPGLSYHYSHSHQNEPERGPRAPVPNLEEEDMPYTPPRQLHPPPTQVPPPQGPPMQSVPPPTPTVPMPPIQSAQHASPVQQHSSPSSSAMSAAARASTAVDDTVEVPRSASGKPLASPSPYCDFCLGDSVENKKTKSAEELVSCSDCGRSAHPTCLQFTANMIISVKKYRWQCIECKSCGLCGTSDNDDQLLFCDDCDRGYHMYCLQPPLSEPPEGSWSCHLCIEEYHTPKR